VIQKALQIARRAKVPAIVDPKGIDFAKYKGAKILKPNVSEAYAAAKKGSHAPLDEVARTILDVAEADLLLITRSEAGISLFDRSGKRSDFPVRSKEVKDVTGAGDTVLAMICLAVASGIEIEAAVQLANIGAGLSIERLGCAQITLSEVARRLLEYEADGKIFDEGRSSAFHQVLKERRYNLLVLEPNQKMTSALFSAIRKCAEKKEEELVVYTQETGDELVSLLTSLNEVDSIVLKKEGLKKLMHTASPHLVYLLKKEEIISPSDPKTLLRSLL
jgi:D-beta-D-heptose 7-phosphate kinase/D-beta-D-heptose 1-phosphate adenosyltransferase